jgi:hypothetical protein
MTFGLYGTTLTTRIRNVGTIFGTTRPENEVSAGSVGTGTGADLHVRWWRGQDLNLRPSGYEEVAAKMAPCALVRIGPCQQR